MKRNFMRILAFIMAFSLLGLLFGCDKDAQLQTNTETTQSTELGFPFDVNKSYLHSRSGIIAGSSCKVFVEPADIVKVHEYVKYPAQGQCGMQDNGSDIYFEGLMAGEVKVTLSYTYPTMEPEEVTFTLKVSDDFTVTKVE